MCSSSLWSGPHGAGEQQDGAEQHGRALHLERVRHTILRGERRHAKQAHKLKLRAVDHFVITPTSVFFCGSALPEATFILGS